MKEENKNKIYKTNSGIPVEEIYEGYNKEKIGRSGEFPFTRGIQANMYRGRLWTMRQYAGFATAKESNERYKYLLSKGQMGLSVAFDLPTQLGLDPDNPKSFGEVGKVGVSISTIDDMRILFDGIPLESVSTSMTINATASILLALYIAIAKEQNADLKKLSGTVQNDLLKEFVARGNYICPPKGSLKLTTDIIEYCSKELPKWNPISISGYHIREAGSNAIQEVAFTLAHAICYVSEAIQRGLDVDEFASRLSFFWNVHNEFFEEVAKFRAARRIWSKIMKERFKAKNPQSMKLRFHAQTAGSTLTAQQVENNIVRVAYQAMAAVLGGCQSLHTNGYDEALALPTKKSATLALRTQQILAFETGVIKTVDPLGGSFYVEALTDEIEKQVLEYLEKIENMGGAVQAIEKGYIQSEISQSAYQTQLAIESKELIVVGVNQFNEEDFSEKQNVFRVDDSLSKNRKKEIESFKANRDKNKVEEKLKNLEQDLKDNKNSMPAIIEAVENKATLGEISDVFRKVFGIHTEWTGV